MHQVEAGPHVGPQLARALQPLVDDLLQLLQPGREPPFPSTPARLAETAVRRPCSFNPLASSGGLPSSVIAERTAEQ